MNLNILEWTEAYLRYRDTVHRKIKEIRKDKSKNEIVCEQKDGITQRYLCLEDLEVLNINELENLKVSCLNTKKNLDWLTSNWPELKETNVIFLFANPAKAAHWSVKPSTHNSVSDKNNIKSGLKSLFESIPEV